MKLKGIYHNPRKKMMTMRTMIKAVVRTVKQKSLLSQKCLLLLTFNDFNQGRGFRKNPIRFNSCKISQSSDFTRQRNVSKNPEMDSSAFQKYLCETPART